MICRYLYKHNCQLLEAKLQFRLFPHAVRPFLCPFVTALGTSSERAKNNLTFVDDCVAAANNAEKRRAGFLWKTKRSIVLAIFAKLRHKNGIKKTGILLVMPAIWSYQLAEMMARPDGANFGGHGCVTFFLIKETVFNLSLLDICCSKTKKSALIGV